MPSAAWVHCCIWESAVVFVTVFAYFLLIVAAISLVAFPALRGRLYGGVVSFLLGGITRIVGGSSLVSGWMSSTARTASTKYVLARSFVVRNPMAVIGASVVILAPSGMAFIVHRPAIFEYSEIRVSEDRQIAVLLTGEQIAPPLPLPPEIFATKEVEMIRPDAIYASRNWSLLQPDFVQRLLVVFKLMKERHGYEMVLIEGYRSPERQAELFAQGGHITQAAANLSYHQHGLAADSAFLRNGQVVISEHDPWARRGYQLYGEIAEQVGFVWGGRWKMLDLGHVELRKAGVLARIR
jgi:peptidoglycan L-alanyl-D-glutamate endopeptidase CwlK